MRRSTPVGAVAERITPDAASFASLPQPLACRIFLALPVDARGRACCVCRAWRDALAAPSLWTRLDMSGVHRAELQRFDDVLFGAAGRAHGQLQVLELSHSQQFFGVYELRVALYANDNYGSLREAHLNSAYFDDESDEEDLAAMPLLQVLTAERTTCKWEFASRILRSEPPFAALQLRRGLEVHFRGGFNEHDFGGMERFGPFAAALADASLQPALRCVCIQKADAAQPAVMGALADAAVARRLRELRFEGCMPPAAAPLARLLAEGSLAVLEIDSEDIWSLFDAAGAALVADALRINTTLTKLVLRGADLTGDVHVAGAIPGALVGHPSLRELRIISESNVELCRSVFGAALGALIAADAPALHVLECRESFLKNAGLAPIVDALPLNRHLHTLDVGYNRISEAFARERLLPAVRANTSLRELSCADTAWRPRAEEEAEELVRRRGQHGTPSFTAAASLLSMMADAVTFASLPLPLAHRVFLALPADARGRASCVCRAWRDVLAEPLLWTHLDMSRVRAEQRFASVLHGAAGRAHGQLRQLVLAGALLEEPWPVSRDVLLPVLSANAGSLRELHLGVVWVLNGHPDRPTVEEIVAAAPLLQVLTADDVTCTWQDALRLLRAESPFAPLQLCRSLDVKSRSSFNEHDFGGKERFGPFLTALADAALQPALQHLCVQHADTAQPALMGALADAVLARRLRELRFYSCTPPAAALLARLLAESSLTVLEIKYPGSPIFDAAGAALVADALRSNTTLTKLSLYNAKLCRDMRVAGTLLGALVGHPILRELRVTETYGAALTAEARNAFGAALAALIAADAPALHVLVCRNSYYSLGDAGLAHIFEALPRNSHLRELELVSNGMSEAFAREQLLPALLTNTALRKFTCASHAWKPPGAAEEAEELVRSRGQHD
jgi:hypothetical protein